MSLNGTYPSFTAATNAVCLGTGYADATGDSIGDCQVLPPGTPTASVNPAFNSALTSLVGQNLPAVSTQPIDLWGSRFVGATFGASTAVVVDGTVSPYYIYYALEGSQQDCKGRRLMHGDGTDWPADLSLTSATNQKYTCTSKKSTACIISLPNP